MRQIHHFWIFWLITLLFTGQNVQKLQILLFFTSYIAGILKGLDHNFTMFSQIKLVNKIWLSVSPLNLHRSLIVDVPTIMGMESQWVCLLGQNDSCCVAEQRLEVYWFTSTQNGVQCCTIRNF